jgi:hypothetical protein
MTTLFANFIKRIIRQENKVLGRWALESCDKKINNKVDWSNTDHCGPCGAESILPFRVKDVDRKPVAHKNDSPNII